MKRVAQAVGVLLIGALALTVFDFQRRLASTGTGLVAQAVVVTGQFYRIPLALELVAGGQVGRLFVSGVNPGVGFLSGAFEARYAPDAPWLPAALAEGLVVLGTEATTTFENAHETACWYWQASLTGPLLLITSRAHMPRASIIFEAVLPGVEIRRAPVDRPLQGQPRPLEFPRYLATRILLLDPRWRWRDCD